jgi:hypothetical protein
VPNSSEEIVPVTGELNKQPGAVNFAGKWALKNNLPDDTAMTVPSNPNKIGEKTSVFGKTGTLFLSAP